MIEYFKLEKWYIFAIFLIFIFAIPFFWLRQGNIGIDLGRELYIPWEMTKGNLLYKNIFIIFAPLSYQINACCLKLLGDKLSTFYILGLLNSFLFLNVLYAISREFLSRINSFLLVILVTFSSVFVCQVCNFNMPYAYAIVYSSSFFLLSLFMLIKYIKSGEVKFAYLSSFFAGSSFVCKYEYLLYLVILFYVYCFMKPITNIQKIKVVGFILLMPIISYGSLICQGVTFSDWYSTLLRVKVLSLSRSMINFYYTTGSLFELSKLKDIIISAFGFVVNFLCLALLYWKKNLFSSRFIQKILVCMASFSLFAFIMSGKYWAFIYLPVLNLLLFAFLVKKIFENKPLFVLTLACILASMKVFFYFDLTTYGAYSVGIVFLCFISIILSKQVANDSGFQKALDVAVKVLMISSIFVLFGLQLDEVKGRQSALFTPKGVMYVLPEQKTFYSKIIDYLSHNAKKQDKVVVLPETPFINFVMDMDSDNQIFLLLPFDIDVWSEKFIVEEYKKSKPKFFIIMPRKLSEYGYSDICQSYAFSVCSFIKNEYNLEAMVGYNIYKRKIQ
ncbi:MAG: glycosyltransferase family 39 protein [Candidatus Gastranaerophilales bacterium]|nr:glycosyltransferase family 39 protein [Candidatus Gastranaerophilales bacterium]